MKRCAIMLLLTALCAIATSGSAKADGGWFGYSGYGFPWFGYGNNGPAAYALGNIPAPPYFALHPPVYYSYPIAHPYGHSPFACPCHGHHGNEQLAVRVIANPHVAQKPSDQAAEKKDRVAVALPRIANPYFQAGLAKK